MRTGIIVVCLLVAIVVIGSHQLIVTSCTDGNGSSLWCSPNLELWIDIAAACLVGALILRAAMRRGRASK